MQWYKEFYGEASTTTKVGVVGLGYVGLPIAVAFASKFPVVGYDINEKRVDELNHGHDRTAEITKQELIEADVSFTNVTEALNDCDLIIVTVPTPIDEANKPDLGFLVSASKAIGSVMKEGCTVVYESTVYPGATEEVCLPILEQVSGMTAGKQFNVGYSPERINPGDKEHTFKHLPKIVSAQDEATLEFIAATYGEVIEAEIYKAPAIKVAEAAKVLENTQRDLNIALMNECSVIFKRLGIDTLDVINAAKTKWNFLPFTPGLVGGHCIGVDPYYLTYKSQQAGYHPEVVLAGRRINDMMASHVVDGLIRLLVKKKYDFTKVTVTVLGLTFKENIPDIRNSKVFDLITQLKQCGFDVQAADAHADAEEVRHAHSIDILPLADMESANIVILAVGHEEYKELGWQGIQALLSDQKGIVMDLKGMLDPSTCPDGIDIWRM
ncbi:nucleotide sugar dehydrogenase [Thalassobacillus hwangdonensis]|uniref:Nucleotide sugar dehydrogenase n=1 Tax=Thalassobacillus hwangdonensis TaxID=546108 RepID=A0ABW3L6J0_9BACI